MSIFSLMVTATKILQMDRKNGQEIQTFDEELYSLGVSRIKLLRSEVLLLRD